ncbi:MAG TPA: DUF480 domain-containing protein [Tepidisphaeraceae bacterium]|jgi:hypothetical protein|nr:DUF480 domain-containing protein [Tepidisphaeraceae bacterium]
MITLTPDEARVLGVLIEKAMTTPDQYPLTQNSVVNGVNQKNNRDPVISMDDNRAFDALEGLRGKGILVRVNQAGSRVDKFRHNAGDVLHARPAELALLAELMLRGPQTLGELRGRASRMSAFESLEAVKNLLDAMMSRDEPLVKLLPPSPGSRAERYLQLLAPDAHPVDASPATEPAAGAAAGNVPSLSDRVTQLEAEVTTLRRVIQAFAQTLGEPDPLAPAPPGESGE